MELRAITPVMACYRKKIHGFVGLTIGKRGSFGFSSLLAAAIGIKAGQRVLLYQDAHDPHRWFLKLEPKENTNAFVVKQAGGNGQLGFSSLGLYNEFTQSLELMECDYNFRVPVNLTPVDGEFYELQIKNIIKPN